MEIVNKIFTFHDFMFQSRLSLMKYAQSLHWYGFVVGWYWSSTATFMSFEVQLLHWQRRLYYQYK